MSDELKTFFEWNDIYRNDKSKKFYVVDPDGFPRSDPEAMRNNRYTEQEFCDRAMMSTVMVRGPFNG